MCQQQEITKSINHIKLKEKANTASDLSTFVAGIYTILSGHHPDLHF